MREHTGDHGVRVPRSDRGVTRRALIGRGSAGAAVLLAGDSATVAHAAVRTVRTVRTRRHARVGRPTLGTELEYYRSDPSHLEARLALCAAAGYTTIQTYVPWNVHVNTRGVADFTGRTHPVILGDHVDEYQVETPDQEIEAGGYEARVIANTDLLGFVTACAQHGFKVILRPGPFISDEWRNGGLPDWLANAYPQMFMEGPNGSTLQPGFPFSPPIGTAVGGGPLFYFAGPSYASPDYLREAAAWLKTFAATVTPLLVSNGGPVTSIQVDDEICFYYRFGPFEVDYHPAMLARFGAVAPTDWPAPGGAATDLLPALQWQRFKADQLGVYLEFLADTLRAGGVDVPITHEEELQLAPPANFARLARAVDELYPEFYLDPAPFTVPTIELCAAAVRASQRGQREVIAAEMDANDPFVRHLLTGEGITGFLGFTYTTGIDEDSVSDIATFDQAITLAGERITRSERVADTAIIWPPEYLYAPPDSTSYGFAHDVRGAIEADIPALALLLTRAGLAFDLIDTDVAEPVDYDRYPTIWLVGVDVLPRSCQRALIRYVRRGGRLICWPAVPTLDENYAPCTELGEALFGQALATFYPQDGQTVQVSGVDVQVWRGVQTFTLSRGVTPVAYRGPEPCGYARRRGRGSATLIGTWPVADSVAGRIGDALEVQDVPPGTGGLASAAASAVTAVYGAATASAVDTTPPPGAGPAQQVIVFEYANTRRGGEVVSGGAVAYWDGENVVPLAAVDATTALPVINVSDPTLARPPFRPVARAHVAMAQALHGRLAACAVSDPRIQARLLRARTGDAATVSLVNRYPNDITFAVTVTHTGVRIRLPRAGELTLPAGQALLLPLGYVLAPGLSVELATVQLLQARHTPDALTLIVTSFSGGDLVLRLPGRHASGTLNGKALRIERTGRSGVQTSIPAGTHTLVVRWR